jgi:hypothetical protein
MNNNAAIDTNAAGRNRHNPCRRGKIELKFDVRLKASSLAITKAAIAMQTISIISTPCIPEVQSINHSGQALPFRVHSVTRSGATIISGLRSGNS